MRSDTPEHRVLLETSKIRARREKEGWFARYCPANRPGIDIGCAGDPVHDSFDQWDVIFGDGDAVWMDGLAAETYHTVYTSHVLEHLADPLVALRRWFELLRPNGHLIVCVPHRDLYEKRRLLPSRFNPDHKSFWLPDRFEPPHTLSLFHTLADALAGEPYQWCLLRVLDDGWAPLPPDVHSCGEYEIEAVVRKLPQGRSTKPVGPSSINLDQISTKCRRVGISISILPGEASPRTILELTRALHASFPKSRCVLPEATREAVDAWVWGRPAESSPADTVGLTLLDPAIVVLCGNPTLHLRELRLTLSRGVPIVATDLAESRNLLGNGAVFSRQDQGRRGLIQAVRRLMADQLACEAIGRRGRAQARRLDLRLGPVST